MKSSIKLTGDDLTTVKIASRIGPIKPLGGTTPHIRTSRALALLLRSSLSLTAISFSTSRTDASKVVKNYLH